jgi:hypothetical protein
MGSNIINYSKHKEIPGLNLMYRIRICAVGYSQSVFVDQILFTDLLMMDT